MRESSFVSFCRGLNTVMEKADKMTGKLKIKMLVTEVGREGKLKLSKSSKQSTKARKRQAEMSKIENPVNRGKKKARWNSQNYNSSHLSTRMPIYTT